MVQVGTWNIPFVTMGPCVVDGIASMHAGTFPISQRSLVLTCNSLPGGQGQHKISPEDGLMGVLTSC